MIRHDILIKLTQFGIFLLLLLFGYYNLHRPLPSWHDEKLVVVISQDSTLPDVEFSRQLAQQFADDLNVPLKVILLPADRIETALRNHEAHLSASGFRLAEKENNALLFGPGYLTVREQVAFNQYQPAPRNLSDLIGKRIAVVAKSNQDKALIALREQMPALTWESRTKQTVEDLLGEVAHGDLDYTVANHKQIEQMLNYHLNLAAAFDIGNPSRLAWAFPADADTGLIAATKQFFADIEKNGALNRLRDRYYGHNDRLAHLDAAAFIDQIDRTLPKFQSVFNEAGNAINEDWRLIAAIAYQESHWDPLATSPTNVRGMMMLTENTADRMNVSNRLDARQSILGGAQYLEQIRDMLPLRIKEPDRTWLALAAYNQGPGHLEDARVLTQRQGGNSDTWVDVKKWMPHLNNPLYFTSLKYGYARGGEAVIFVENIRAYSDMLSRLTRASETVVSALPQTPNYQLISAPNKPAFASYSLRNPEDIPGKTRAASSYSLSR